MLKILRVLVPIDFSEESDFALEWAVMIAGKNPGATIYLLHVLPPAPSGFGAVAYQAEQEEMETKLIRLQNRIPGNILSFAFVEKGNISDAVKRICERREIDLVIMTTRGRRGLKHFLPESTTEDTIRVTPCPVLVLHLNAKNHVQVAQMDRSA